MDHGSDEAGAIVDRVRNALKRSPRDVSKAAPSVRNLSPSRREGCDFGALPEFEQLRIQKAAGELLGLENPFYQSHETRASATTIIGGESLTNFSSYDYLGLNGHPEIVKAAKGAIDDLGTSVSASRLTAGEREIHRDLERALAELHGTEDAISFVSGHATNVSVIGGLLNQEDLIVTDTLIHNSVIEGAKLSGAKRILCPHGDMDAFERALRLNRKRHRRTLIVIEGLYSMDGDTPDLHALVRFKRRYNAWLMVDEAHSAGVLGKHGRGVAEEQNVDPREVDIWMGTLSKAFTSAGGYIAGSGPLIEVLKYTSPGLVYSVGAPPSSVAAARVAIEVMARENWRVKKLRDNGQYFLQGAKARGLDTGTSIGASVIPVIVGSSPMAIVLSQRLRERGFNVVPIIFPGVAENQARLRFFITAAHSFAQIDGVLDAVAAALPEVRSMPSIVSLLAPKAGAEHSDTP